MFAACYVVLGLAVAHVPPGAFDRTGQAFLGQAPSLAEIFTRSCSPPVLGVFTAVLLVIAWRFPAWRPRVAYAFVVALAGWQLSDVLKRAWGRPRPDHWLRFHETSFAYASGHAMFAVVIYGLWAWFLWHSSLPRPARFAASALLAFWALGIVWSRLALGAHWPTDLAGGVLLGASVLAAASAVRAGFASRARRIATP